MSVTFEILKTKEVKITFDKFSRQLALANNRTSIKDIELEKLRKHFKCHAFSRNPEEIYSETYLDFFFKYGLSNILKNYYAISEIKALGLFSDNNLILDIGSGPGITALALNLFCNKNDSFSNQNFKVVLQDCSSEFLQLFKILWKDISLNKKPHLEISLRNELFTGKISKESFSPSIVIMSNSLAEMLRDERFSLDVFVKSLVEIEPIIVIIDYGYEKFQNIFDQFISKIESHYDEISLYTWPSWNKSFKSIDLNPLTYSCGMNMNFSSNVSFIKSIYIPKKDQNKYKPEFYTDIVLLYKRSWEDHDLNLLDDLFTDDATYIINPKRAPLKGIKSIREYWHYNSLKQETVSFYPQYISLDFDTIHCNWISIFYRKDLGKWMLLNGTFDARLKANKIIYFEEQFSKQLFEEKPSMSQKDIIQDLECNYK